MGSNCVGCTGHKARLETILFNSNFCKLSLSILIFLFNHSHCTFTAVSSLSLLYFYKKKLKIMVRGPIRYGTVYRTQPLRNSSLLLRCIYAEGFALYFINPRRACAARVTVVVLCVCLSVCLSTAILGLQATRRLMSDTNIFSATRAGKIMWLFC